MEKIIVDIACDFTFSIFMILQVYWRLCKC